MSLSGDGARLYTVCRDNTVYAYSTSHLQLGHAPELSKMTNSKPRRSGGHEKEGLGPIYGFRHPKFHASTFYVKSALRAAKDDKTELLAVGSSDGCAVLFPTDERYMNHSSDQRIRHSADLFGSTPPSLTRTVSSPGVCTRVEDSIPIYQYGSALIRGHDREVTGMSWTHEGELVTVSDDFTARCWREGAGSIGKFPTISLSHAFSKPAYRFMAAVKGWVARYCLGVNPFHLPLSHAWMVNYQTKTGFATRANVPKEAPQIQLSGNLVGLCPGICSERIYSSLNVETC